MTVAELIEHLSKLPPDTVVLDQYGNQADMKDSVYYPVKGELHLSI